MKLFKRSFALFALTLFFLSPLLSASTPCALYWEKDFQEALIASQPEKKIILVFFNGSDWSVEGMKMKSEIFENPSFQSRIVKDLLFVEVDFPKHLFISPEKEALNLVLKQRFQIEEIPSVVLLDSTEREIARLGYLPEKASQFADDLVHIVEIDRKLVYGLERIVSYSPEELKDLYQIAQELQRKESYDLILDAGIQSGSPHFFLLEKYRLLVNTGNMKSIEALQLRDHLLNRGEAETHFSVALIDFQELSKNPEPTGPEKVVAPLEEYLNKYRELDMKNVWQIEMMIAQVFLDYDQWKTALKHAEFAFQTVPPELKEEVKRSVNYIRDQSSQIANK